MATYIKTLKEDNGDITYPQTKAGAVLLDSGTDLETELSQFVTAEDIASTSALTPPVQTNMIANSAVTTAKIASSAVTADKIDWTTTDFTDSITYTQPYANASFRKFGKLVIFTFQSARKAWAEGELLLTIPSGYRPATVKGSDGQYWLNAAADNAVTRVYIIVNDGKMYNAVAASNARIYVQGSYFTA